MSADAEFTEGFEKYGAIGTTPGAALWTQGGDWTAVANPANIQIVAPLSPAAVVAPGSAMQIAVGGASVYSLSRSFAPGQNYARVIGSAYIACTSSTSLGATNMAFVFHDNGNAQFAIQINGVSQTVSAVTGDIAGTAAVTSSASLVQGQTYLLEWDVTVGTTGIGVVAGVWLNGGRIVQPTVFNSRNGSTNNYFNGVKIVSSTGNFAVANITVDHLYLRLFTAGGSADTVRNAAYVVLTQLASADVQAQFTLGAGVLGTNVATAPTTSSSGANVVVIRKVTAQASGTVSAINFIPNITNGAKMKGVIYSDAAGSPSTLMSSGTEVVGLVSGTTVSLPLVTPQTIVAGTQYWIGVFYDIAINVQLTDNLSNKAFYQGVTYAAGVAPTTFASSGTTADWLIWGTMTAEPNSGAVAQNPSLGDTSYITGNTVGLQDKYSFPAIAIPVSQIYTVALKANIKKNDPGDRTIDLRMQSGGVESSGLFNSFHGSGILNSAAATYFPNDPATGASWAKSAVDAATGGPIITA